MIRGTTTNKFPLSSSRDAHVSQERLGGAGGCASVQNPGVPRTCPSGTGLWGCSGTAIDDVDPRAAGHSLTRQRPFFPAGAHLSELQAVVQMGLRSQYLFFYNTILTFGWWAPASSQTVVGTASWPRHELNLNCVRLAGASSYTSPLRPLSKEANTRTSMRYALSPARASQLSSSWLSLNPGTQATIGPLKIAQTAAVLEVFAVGLTKETALRSHHLVSVHDRHVLP